MAGGILAYGELLWDLLPEKKLLGGAPANFSSWMAALGRRTALATAAGMDDLGEKGCSGLSAAGVDTAFVQRISRYPTGTVEVRFSPIGEPLYVINRPAAYDYIEPTAELLDEARRCDAVYFGTLAQRNKESRETLAAILEAAARATRLLDVNLRKDCYDEASVLSSLKAADILKCSRAETGEIAQLLAFTAEGPRAFAAEILKRFPLRVCVVTDGAAGAYARAQSGAEADAPGCAAAVVDTIGAGDAFCAGFLDAFLQGDPLERCCMRGNELGAAACEQEGGISNLNP